MLNHEKALKALAKDPENVFRLDFHEISADGTTALIEALNNNASAGLNLSNEAWTVLLRNSNLNVLTEKGALPVQIALEKNREQQYNWVVSIWQQLVLGTNYELLQEAFSEEGLNNLFNQLKLEHKHFVKQERQPVLNLARAKEMKNMDENRENIASLANILRSMSTGEAPADTPNPLTRGVGAEGGSEKKGLGGFSANEAVRGLGGLFDRVGAGVKKGLESEEFKAARQKVAEVAQKGLEKGKDALSGLDERIKETRGEEIEVKQERRAPAAATEEVPRERTPARPVSSDSAVSNRGQEASAAPTETVPQGAMSQQGGGEPELKTIAQKAQYFGLDIMAANDQLVGREKEVNQLLSWVNKRESVMLIGEPGVGKRTLAYGLATGLEESGKQVIRIPASFFPSGKVGAIGEAINDLCRVFGEDLEKIVWVIEDAPNVMSLGTFGDGSVDHETPRSQLKRFLGQKANPKMTFVMISDPDGYQKKLKEKDESFCASFQNYRLKGMSLQEAVEIATAPRMQAQWKEKGIELNPKGKPQAYYNQVVQYCAELTDQFAPNQQHPEKTISLLKRVLFSAQWPNVTQQDINQALSEQYHIPIEFVAQSLKDNGVLLGLKDSMSQRVMGQDKVIEKISQKVMSFAQSRAKAPLSFFCVGPSGVGKTETALALADMLGVKSIKFNMGEYKSGHLVQDFVQKIQPFLKENYTGVIIFDEIEKADPQVLDVILALTDKGEMGSGEEKVKSPASIIFCTSNILQQEIRQLESMVKEAYGAAQTVPEATLRELIVKSGQFRPEFMGRISSTLHYDEIKPELAVRIGQSLMEKRCKEFEAQGRDWNVQPEVIAALVQHQYYATEGVRSVQKALNQLVEKVLTFEPLLRQLGEAQKVGHEGKAKQDQIDVKWDSGLDMTIDLNGKRLGSISMGQEQNMPTSLEDLIKAVQEKALVREQEKAQGESPKGTTSEPVQQKPAAAKKKASVKTIKAVEKEVPATEVTEKPVQKRAVKAKP